MLVQHVDELVHHDVVAPLCRLTTFGNILPRQHYRPALHRLTRQFFEVLMHHTVLVDRFSASRHGALMDHDALEAVVAV